MLNKNKPKLTDLGRDLLEISTFKKIVLLILPFLFTISYFVLAYYEFWILSIFSLILLSFFTYGSISHDLVHRSLKLPRNYNTFFLSTIELLTLRSGHAYRLAHLHHHRHYPHDDDIEGAASKMSFIRTLLEGVIFQPKICIWALKTAKKKKDRILITIEVVISILIICLSLILISQTVILVVYSSLLIMGSWIIPLITSYLPHAPDNDNELSQTRLFRGKILSIIALEHLYHLEHHLYPSVPHTNWPKLAKRLDPFFQENGIKPIKLWF